MSPTEQQSVLLAVPQHRRRVLPAWLALGLFAAGAASAQDIAPTGRGPGTMTRGMALFGRAEASLLDALKSGDAASLDRLVGPYFEQRGPLDPGTPTPRAAWLRQAGADAAASLGLRQMAVQDLADVAVVSFLWERAEPVGNAFVVDVWKRKPPEDYRLVARYLSSPAGAGVAPAPARPVVDPRQ